jgi:ABC-2 type transport system permease protein
MINAFRYGFLGASDVKIELAFGIISGTILMLLAWALLLLHRGTGLKG